MVDDPSHTNLQQKVDQLICALSGDSSAGRAKPMLQQAQPPRPHVRDVMCNPPRAELLQPPKVGIAEFQGRFRASHRRAVSASSEGGQLSRVRDVVVLGPWRVAKALAAGDSTRLQEGFQRRGVQGLYSALQAIDGSISACHGGRASRMCRWDLEVENIIGNGGERRSRAVCRCDTEEDIGRQVQVHQVTITSPWRSSRVHSEKDLHSIRTAFQLGGLAAAKCAALPDDDVQADVRVPAQPKSASTPVEVDRPPGYFGSCQQVAPSVRLQLSKEHHGLQHFGGRELPAGWGANPIPQPRRLGREPGRLVTEPQGQVCCPPGCLIRKSGVQICGGFVSMLEGPPGDLGSPSPCESDVRNAISCDFPQMPPQLACVAPTLANSPGNQSESAARTFEVPPQGSHLDWVKETQLEDSPTEESGTQAEPEEEMEHLLMATQESEQAQEDARHEVMMMHSQPYLGRVLESSGNNASDHEAGSTAKAKKARFSSQQATKVVINAAEPRSPLSQAELAGASDVVVEMDSDEDISGVLGTVKEEQPRPVFQFRRSSNEGRHTESRHEVVDLDEMDDPEEGEELPMGPHSLPPFGCMTEPFAGQPHVGQSERGTGGGDKPLTPAFQFQRPTAAGCGNQVLDLDDTDVDVAVHSGFAQIPYADGLHGRELGLVPQNGESANSCHGSGGRAAVDLMGAQDCEDVESSNLVAVSSPTRRQETGIQAFDNLADSVDVHETANMHDGVIQTCSEPIRLPQCLLHKLKLQHAAVTGLDAVDLSGAELPPLPRQRRGLTSRCCASSWQGREVGDPDLPPPAPAFLVARPPDKPPLANATDQALAERPPLPRRRSTSDENGFPACKKARPEQATINKPLTHEPAGGHQQQQQHPQQHNTNAQTQKHHHQQQQQQRQQQQQQPLLPLSSPAKLLLPTRKQPPTSKHLHTPKQQAAPLQLPPQKPPAGSQRLPSPKLMLPTRKQPAPLQHSSLPPSKPATKQVAGSSRPGSDVSSFEQTAKGSAPAPVQREVPAHPAKTETSRLPGQRQLLVPPKAGGSCGQAPPHLKFEDAEAQQNSASNNLVCENMMFTSDN